MPPRRPASALAAVLTSASVLAVTPASPAAAAGPTVFVNEIHYDNSGTDAGEFVEVAAPAGTDLTGWSVVLYNGSNGAVYGTRTLSGPVPGDSGHGFVGLDYPVNGLQNGPSDGVALVDAAGVVVQFLSYEGEVTAVGGPAAGRTSEDIGVDEDPAPDTGQSLQLTGEGSGYTDFTWTGPADDSPGAVNAGQTVVEDGEPGNAAPTVDAGGPYQVTEGGSVTLAGAATDPEGDAVTLTWTAEDPGITVDDPTSATPTVTVDGVAPGRYTLTLTAQDTAGATGSDTTVLSVTPTCYAAPPATTPISCVQGSGAASPVEGEPVRVEGVVTAQFEEDDVVTGVFLQEEDADADDDRATSEAVFLDCGGPCPAGLATGAVAAATGTAREQFGSTWVTSTPADVTVTGARYRLPTPVPVQLPAAGGTDEEATFEAVESMHVVFPDTLVVSEYFELARFGSLVLTVGARPYQFTHQARPSVAGYQAFLEDLATRRIILDDDNNDSNDAITGPAADEAYYYPEGGLSYGNRFRGGDTIRRLAGVMDFAFGEWRVRPIPAVHDYDFRRANPRPAAPEPVGGDLRVASFNVLNYFTTIDETSSTRTGPCGPTGGLDCRGADSVAELERQRAKIVAALTEIDADVVGLIEIQNDAGASTQDLVAALNAAAGAGTYAAIHTGTIGTDAIKVALVYQPAAVRPVGDYAVLDSSVDPRFRDRYNRPVLIQTFEEVATGERFTVAVNHLKSKGSACDEVGDPDRGDGAGNCDETRTLAAQALADYLATDPTGSGDPDVLVIGDLNSYRNEDPIVALEDAGYTDLVERFQGDRAYSYVFDGQLGYLDHALATRSLTRQVTGVTEWHINADEPPLFDYNDAVDDTGEAWFERESTVGDLYAPDPYRSSDHDPVVVGLNLRGLPPVADAGGPYRVRVGRSIALDASGSSDPEGAALSYAWDLDADGRFDDATGVAPTFTARGRGPGWYLVRLRVSDGASTDTTCTLVHVHTPGRGNGGHRPGRD